MNIYCFVDQLMHTEMTQTTCVKLFCAIEIVLAFKLSMDVQKIQHIINI